MLRAVPERNACIHLPESIINHINERTSETLHRHDIPYGPLAERPHAHAVNVNLRVEFALLTRFPFARLHELQGQAIM